jgi:hypothetical protein
MHLTRSPIALGIAVAASLTLQSTSAHAQQRKACGSWSRGYATIWYWPAPGSQVSNPAPEGVRTSFYNGAGRSSEIQGRTSVMPAAVREPRVLPFSEMGNQNFPTLGP